GWHVFVHEAECVRATGADRIPRDRHLQRAPEGDPRAEERAAAGREQPALYLWKPERRVRRRDDHVAPEEQLEAAGERGRVRRADEGDGDRALGQPQERPAGVVVTETRVLTGGEGPQVHAGAEGTVTGAGEDEGPDLRIRLGVDDRAADAPGGLRGQGVAAVAG